MGSMWRSEPMCLCDMYMPPEAAFEIFTEIGEMELIQVVDMTPDVPLYSRHFVSEVCRHDALERKLYYLHGEMVTDNIVETWDASNPKPLTQREITNFEAELEKWEQEIISTSEYQKTLLKDYMSLKQYFYVLTEIGPILGNADLHPKLVSKGEGDQRHHQLVVLTGVVRRAMCYKFELMLWRVSRGNMYYRQATRDELVIDPYTRKPTRTVAFIAVCNGNELRTRFEKVCTGFRVTLFPCPRTATEREAMARTLGVRLADIEQVIKKTNFHKCKLLRIISRHWHNWMLRTKKAKAIYHCLNLFSLDITNKCMIGQCWLAERELPFIQKMLTNVSKKLGCNANAFIQKVKTHQEPPTFHRTNKFTNGFQNLINAYGDATYRELNPGLYTLITFPFLFSVMFGDMGHGLIMFCFAMFMVAREKKYNKEKSDSEIWNIFFQGRYILLMMSIFSILSGFIYNDMFSKVFVFRQPYWMNHYTDDEIMSSKNMKLDPRAAHFKPYPYGMDPAWVYAKNKIMSQNSIKMKFSIIIGIIHMEFGIILGLFNHLHFKEYHAIFFELIPQIIFMTCLFFWLVLMIYFKWFFYFAGAFDPKHEIGCAPLILILFIDMALMKSTEPVDPHCSAYLFSWQPILQKVLLIVSLLTIPIMLFATPLYLKRVHKRKRREIVRKINAIRKKKKRKRYVYEKTEHALLANLETCSRGLGEMVISEDIHTVEFVLSTVSHTASYLRLWALSLAHAQLSDMLWLMVLMKNGLTNNQPYAMVAIFLAFGLWAVLTVAILVVMEGLSAFLHTLRLHWVEFMSKFFQGAGIPFEPFSFKEILEADEKKPETVCKTLYASKEDSLYTHLMDESDYIKPPNII